MDFCVLKLLNMTIKPLNYRLSFEPDLRNFVFIGKEVLTFEVINSTDRLELDSVELEINNCEVLAANKNIVSSFKVEPTTEKLIINLKKELKNETYKLKIEFEGILNDKLAGFYRSKYIVSGKEKYLATTQFEAADARRAFPCIDDPSFKSTFDVTLIIDKNLTAISNTLPAFTSEVKVKQKKSNTSEVFSKQLIKFNTTPKMSTYLLYLGVGEFEFVEDKFGNVILRVVTTPGKSRYGKFALDVAKKVLKYFEEYFDFPYPLEKLDLIAIPDFASGAMENWGAITFRENALLYYPNRSSKATKQRIAGVIAHEIAHMWFGDLVTMKWWDDLWLNESFATYMANKAVDSYWKDWDVWSQYVSETIFEGMALDSLSSSHAIKVRVKNLAELDELFDEIAYEKGGSILRMLDLYLGEKKFRDGLREYIKIYKYKNAGAEDLWNTLEKQSGKTVINIMQKYIEQVGLPKVKVEKVNDRLILKQERFLLLEEEKSQIHWNIPLVIQSGQTKLERFILNNKQQEFKLIDKFINVNYDYSSFFISEYSPHLFKDLEKNISLLMINDKLGIIHDLSLMIFSGRKNLSELYQCINTFFTGEKSNTVLHYIISKLSGIYLLVESEEAKNLAIKFSKKSLDLIGFEPMKKENILDSYLRSAALSSLTLFDDKEVEKFIEKKFIKFLEDKNSLHPDLRSIVYSSSVWFDGRNYNLIKEEYEESLVQEEKAKLLSALGFAKDKEKIKKTLEYITSSRVPLAFLPYGVNSVARNPYAKKIVLDWLYKTFPILVKRTGGLANMLLRRILQSIIPTCGIGNEQEVKEFLLKNKTPGLERTVEQVSEELLINSRFVRKYNH